MAFWTTFMIPSGARLSMRTRCWLTHRYSGTKLRYLGTSMTVSNQYPSLQAMNRQIESTYMCRHLHASNATSLTQRTKANPYVPHMHNTYLPHSNYGSMRERAIYPMMQMWRNYSNGAPPENPRSTDPKSSASANSSSGGSTPEATAASAPAQSSAQRVRIILREYGTVAVVFHISMSLCVLSVCYILVSK